MDKEGMNLTSDAMELLRLVTEDYSELFTAHWSFRLHSPDSSEAELRQRAVQAISTLFAENLIALYRCNIRMAEKMRETTPEEANALLTDPLSWQEPTSDAPDYICYAATDEGIMITRNI